MSLAVAGAFVPWTKVLAQSKVPTSADVESKFLIGPVVLELPIAGKVQFRCVAVVTVRASGDLAT